MTHQRELSGIEWFGHPLSDAQWTYREIRLTSALLIVVALWFDGLFGKRLILSVLALIQVYEAQLDLQPTKREASPERGQGIGTKNMFVGHYGVSFAAKGAGKRVPLWVWFIAVQWLDVIWSVLVLMGIEKLRIVPGFTEANALDLYYMPYTHGLPGAIVLSLIFGGIVALFTTGNRGATILLVAAASFSHWVLDLVVHTPDLPLYDNAAKVGFGLWRHVAFSFPLELIVLGLGAWLYARVTTFANAKGRYVFWGFVIFLAAMQVYANFGPPPSSPEAMAVIALVFYMVLALLAASVERIATVPTEVKRAQ